MTTEEKRDEQLPTKEEIAARLEQEIERLRSQVTTRLGPDSDEAKAALDSLDQAKAIVAEETERLDEAFYQVGLVKATLGRRQNLRQWSAKWGVILLFYSIVWLILFLAGMFFTWNLTAIFNTSGDPTDLMKAALLPAMAGGIGGALRDLYMLFRQVFIQRTFEPQYIMYYLMQPVIGFFLGAVAYLIVQAGFLVLTGALSFIDDNPGNLIPIYVFVAVQLIISFWAGFNQQYVLGMIDKITQRLSPRSGVNESDEPESAIPQTLPKRGAKSNKIR